MAHLKALWSPDVTGIPTPRVPSAEIQGPRDFKVKHSREYSSTIVRIFQRPAVLRPVRHEVIRSDVVAIRWALTNA